MLKIFPISTDMQLATCFSLSEVQRTQLGLVWVKSEVICCVVWDEILQCVTEKVFPLLSKDFVCVAMHMSSA